MEKKYLTAIAKLSNRGNNGDIRVIFDDVKDVQKTETRLSFTDKDDHYEFEKAGNEWKEVNDKAPNISDVNIICRRTARKHYLVGSDRTEVSPTAWTSAWGILNGGKNK